MPRKTSTSDFGVSKREGHDSSGFYRWSLYTELPQNGNTSTRTVINRQDIDQWADRIYCQSAEKLPLPDNSAALAFTSPPYKCRETIRRDMSLDAYLGLIRRVRQRSIEYSRQAGAA